MAALLLLGAVTILYAGYNVAMKLSGNAVPEGATTTILATICVQLAALACSLIFLVYLLLRGGAVFSLSQSVYVWAAISGLCIGAAEIGYLYLFGGVGRIQPLAANLVIPTVVSGTVVLALIFSILVLKEGFTMIQFAGVTLTVAGIVILFAGRSLS